MACNWLMMTSSGEDNWPWEFGSAHRQKKKNRRQSKKPRSCRLGGFLLCLRFFSNYSDYYFFLIILANSHLFLLNLQIQHSFHQNHQHLDPSQEILLKIILKVVQSTFSKLQFNLDQTVCFRCTSVQDSKNGKR